MATVVVKNIDPRIDGEYDLVTVDQWTHDEWHRVKKLTGLKVGDFVEANEAHEADADAIYALALISCDRAGKQNAAALLKQGRLGDIDFVNDPDVIDELGGDTGEGDAVPPPQTSTGSGNGSSDGTQQPGASMSESSDLSENVLRLTGAQI